MSKGLTKPLEAGSLEGARSSKQVECYARDPMSRFWWRPLWMLVLGVLAACATVPASESEVQGCEVAAEAVVLDDVCRDEHTLLAHCDGQQCGLYRCQEVLEHLSAGRVVRTWAEVEPLAEVGVGAQRYWGSAQELPWNSRPVFIIPWDHKPELLPSQQLALEEAARELTKPREKHHIFPQAFRKWFTRKGIKIDAYTIALEVMKHRSIHRGENGGPWNAAWDAWILDHDDAPQEEIFRYAGQLIYKFELFGPVLPYWKRPPPLPAGY
jgi:uncharacterized lipoprotein (TIGR02269 family)